MTRSEMIRRYSEIQCCSYEMAADAVDTVVTLISEGLEQKKRRKYTNEL